MTDMNDGVIRISRDEAQSEHVDDLLKRQMSMRGEPGVTREKRRKWFYQNWFVFMIAGALGATAAWALIEPYFQDELYVQGPITALTSDDSTAGQLEVGKKVYDIRSITSGSFQMNGDRILISNNLTELAPGGRKHRLRAADLQNGVVIGAYVEYHRGLDQEIAIAHFIDLHPKPVRDAGTPMTLSQLSARSHAAGLLLFPLVAGLIGLFIGAIDGLVCRLPRRAALCGAVGFLVGGVGGFVSTVIATLAYIPLNQLAEAQMGDSGSMTGFAFMIQMVGRSLAWGIAGTAMGLGQGLALRSKRLVLYGLIGGIVGGLFGGLLFDPIDMILLPPDKPSAWLSRLIGLAVIGASVGAMIGVVELLARDAWLRMTQGPLTGKEFFLFKDLMRIGSSPRSDVYLFNDAAVAKQHASIRTLGDEFEIEAHEVTSPVLHNTRPVQHARLRHGDTITIGRTSFVFQRRKG